MCWTYGAAAGQHSSFLTVDYRLWLLRGTGDSPLVRYSTSPIGTELDFVNASAYVNSWVPHAPGVLEVQTASGLASNTTYYFAVKGADTAGNTGYLSNGSAAATLTDVLTGIQIVDVYQSSVTLSWSGLGAGNAEGYLLQASTMSDFSSTIRSSATADVSQTTLTVANLRRGKLTYFRVGGLNWDNVANFVLASSTITLPGPPPINPTIQAVYQSSITLQWGAVASDDGYSAEAATDNLFTTIAQSSVTADGNAGTLTLQNLEANATYYLRVGSLYDNDTNYAFVTPLSTVTLPAVPVPGAFAMVGATSMTVTWGAGINAPGTSFQTEISSISAVGAATATWVTSGLTATFTGLLQDTTYWARVEAIGIDGDSAYLFIGSTITYILPPQGVSFTDIELASMTVGWIYGGANLTYNVDLAPANPFAPHFSSSTANASATLSALSPDSLYSARVQAQSLITGHLSRYSSIVSSYTLAEPPLNLSTTTVTEVSVGLAWDGNGNPSTALYGVERSLDGITFIEVAQARTPSYSDQNVSGGISYTYRVRAINENGTPSAYSNLLVVLTPGVPTAPKVPSGYWAAAQTIGSSYQVTYHWRAVTERTDGSPLTNLADYEIYISSNVLAPMNQWVLVTTVTATSWTTAAAPNSPAYYALRAVDTGGVQSGYTHIIDDGAELVHYFISSDGFTRAQVPQNAANVLRQEYNTFGTDLTLQWTEVPAEETGRVVRAMTLQAISANTGNVVTGVSINPPALIGIIGYSVSNGQIVSGTPKYSWVGTVNSPAAPLQMTMAAPSAALIPTSQAASDLSLFWYTGVEWVKTTGQVDTTNNDMSFTGSRLGSFQIRVASHAPGGGSQITLTSVYPRIITPNGDGWNDKAIFQFDNPQLLPLSGKIFDLTGRSVASLAAGPNPDSTLVWDGKDSGGRVVPAGIYLYSVTTQGATLTGTVVVAR